MKKINCIPFVIILLFGLSIQAQTKQWTLEECVKYAIDNNISIKQIELDAQTAANQEIEKARVAFEQEKTSAVAAIRKEAASLSLDLAEKVLKSQLKDKAAQEKLVTEWMADVKLS
jgi:F0F1-type ATP synthase membrane subunit b/b'